MADTRVQHEVEEWVRSVGLPAKFGTRFHKMKLELNAGGKFEFDAVSEDRNMAVVISTAGAKTSGGRNAIGKMHKVRADILFLTMAEVPRRVVAFTERCLFEHFKKEQERGRVPKSIEFEPVDIPLALNERLQAARAVAADEVRPVRSPESPTPTDGV